MKPRLSSTVSGAFPEARKRSKRDNRAMSKPGLKYNGKTIIEQDRDGFLILLPNGQMRCSLTANEALEWARLHFSSETPSGFLGIGLIEYRPLQAQGGGVQ